MLLSILNSKESVKQTRTMYGQTVTQDEIFPTSYD